MKIISKLLFLLKYCLLGLTFGYAVLFFAPNSQLSFNWQEVQNAWFFYKDASKKSKQNPIEALSNSNQNNDHVTHDGEFSFASAIKKAGPSVVSVKAIRQRGVRPDRDGAPGDMLVDVYIELGSGVIFSKDGYVVTNYHVIADTDSIMLHFSNGIRKYAKIVGFDKANDIAVLKVDIETPMVAVLGKSSDVRTGDIVMAIGTPFGLFENSVSMGIVSAINHGMLYPRIQTDASMNQGNSGGALIDVKGNVIGISTAKFSVNRDDEIGINFATPIDVVKEVFDEIVKHGRVVRNWIGLDASILTRAGHQLLSPGVKFGIGLFVSGTQPNSPAEEAGLQYKDLLTHYDGQLITSGEQFRKLFMLTPIGDSVKITYIRNKVSIETYLNLREKPKD